MILADTSVWVDHLREPIPELMHAWVAGFIVTHPFVVGEVALGSLKNRTAVLSELNHIVQLPVASTAEVASLIEEHQLFGRGVGYVDCHLIASVRLIAGARLWSTDKRLCAEAERLRIAYLPQSQP